jgi:hypothetical protein
MPVHCAREATDLDRKASKALGRAATGREAPPYIHTRTLETLSQLRNVNVGISALLVRDPPPTPRGAVLARCIG